MRPEQLELEPEPVARPVPRFGRVPVDDADECAVRVHDEIVRVEVSMRENGFGAVIDRCRELGRDPTHPIEEVGIDRPRCNATFSDLTEPKRDVGTPGRKRRRRVVKAGAETVPFDHVERAHRLAQRPQEASTPL